MKRLIRLCGVLLSLGLISGESWSEEKPNPMTQIVIVEGVGANGDEALKDAFRNAVRQVVGAVVDAETLIKNDELISDKVLTYSGGCVKKYDEISKKENKGLVRIKIKAEVENKEVIAKLKAANVKVKDFDGKGLFAEVVTELNREKDAAALLKKAFEGFPQNCMGISIVGKPNVIEKNDKNATVELTVLLEPEPNAYKAFSTHMISILEKIAKSKGEFTGQFFERKDREGKSWLTAEIGKGRDVTIESKSVFQNWLPNVKHDYTAMEVKDKHPVIIAVATNRTKAGDRIEFKYFQVDNSLQPMLAEIASRTGKGKLQLLDNEAGNIATERFPLSVGKRDKYSDPKLNISGATLITAFGSSNLGWFKTNLTGIQNSSDSKSSLNQQKKLSQIFFISPVFFWYDEESSYGSLGHQLAPTIAIQIKLSLEELKLVKDTKVEINFGE